MNFKNKTVLVTGASRGMGLDIAKKFLAAGANVIALNKSPPLEDLNKEYSKSFLEFPGDVSKPESIEAAFNAANEKFGTVEILINNAGILNRTKFLDENLENFMHTFQTNTASVFFCTQAFKKQLKNLKGSIVNIGSLRVDKPTGPVYAASKAAVHNLTVSLGKELGPQIRVNCIAPGLTLTTMHEDKSPEQIKAMAEQNILKKLSSTEDISNAVLFMASENAASITGQTLLVDNGNNIF